METRVDERGRRKEEKGKGEKAREGSGGVYICVDTERATEKRARSTLHKEDPLDQIKNVL